MSEVKVNKDAKVNKEVKDERVLNIKIPNSLHRMLRMKAADQDVSLKEIVIKALNEHLKAPVDLKITEAEQQELDELEEAED